MTPTQTRLKLNYYRGPIRAQLSSRSEASGVWLWVGEPACLQAETGNLELLVQPLAPTGHPYGTARRLYEAAFALSHVPNQPTASAYVPLPFRFTVDRLRDCYLRVTLDTITDCDPIKI